MKEWYLLTPDTRPNSTGGYENDSFVDFKDDAFYEVLATDIGATVQLYNHDRSVVTDIRCIIQDSTANTQLKSMERSILAPIGTLKAGMYIFHENCYWLISGYPGNNGIYEKATIILCQCILKWQNDDGKIIERPANVVSAAKYDTGTNGNNYILLASNNFTIWIPDDDDSATLEQRRVFIDRNAKNPRKVYEITRSDDVLYLFGEDHGGILSFIADRDEFNSLVDRPDLGICDYREPTASQPSVGQAFTTTISGGNTLRCGRAKSWTVTFTDENGGEVSDVDYTWNVKSDFDVEQTITDNKIQLRVNNEDCIGSLFLLQIISGDSVLNEIEITVTNIF